MTSELYTESTPRTIWSGKSRKFLVAGAILCSISCICAVLSTALPYWIYIDEILETTVAGLTDDTKVTYNYGLIGYCLYMKATHVNVEECGNRGTDTLQWWERITLYLMIVSIFLCLVSIVNVTFNLRCWDKLALLVISTLSAASAGICQSVSVSIYQIYSSVLTVPIGGLTSANFRQDFLHVGYWLGFVAGTSGILAALLLMFGTFVWERPKESLRLVPQYTTIVFAPRRCPYRGRKPVAISVSHM